MMLSLSLVEWACGYRLEQPRKLIAVGPLKSGHAADRRTLAVAGEKQACKRKTAIATKKAKKRAESQPSAARIVRRRCLWHSAILNRARIRPGIGLVPGKFLLAPHESRRHQTSGRDLD